MIYDPLFEDKRDLQSTHRLLHKLLPSLVGFKLEKVNLNDLVRDYFKIYPEKNTAEYRLDPRVQQKIINRIFPAFENACAYGGWMENRQYVWAGTYMDKDKRYVHLGVDVVVSAGTPVYSPVEGVIEDIFIDKDTDVGWGGRIILRPFDGRLPLLVFGHLELKIFLNLGNMIKPCDFIGNIGKPPLNGNVFEHLHIQAITREFAE